jgi:hypothetical protein
MVPGWPPIFCHRRWASHIAAAIPQAINSPYT